MSEPGTRSLQVSRPLILLVLLSLALCAFSWLLVFGMTPKTLPQETPAWQSLGSQGDKHGQFQQPRGITGFPDGSFVVVDRAARVQHFSAEGKPLTLWSMKEHDLGNPKGLTALPDGNLLVCDTHYGRVLKMSVDGKIIRQWGGPGRGPSEFTHPLSAICDAQRKVVYVVEYGDRNDRVQKFDLDGTFLKSWGSFGSEPGEFQRPSGIALDANGNVYVADACNHRIQKFDPEGKLLLSFSKMGYAPGELRYPYDIACAPDGHLYVAEFNGHRVSVFDADGKFLRCIGSAGAQPGEFANPWALTIDARGRLLVSDTGNHRIQIFDLKEKETRLAAKDMKPRADVLESKP
ncbi:MAG TPA: 6-bladed beta-propeller [Planctomycetota bacterium]|nr:6-bladed beta-propeller [Planctomycetota bacterium]